MQRLISIFALVAMIFCFSNRAIAAESQDKWLIYWYICGSNLESEAGHATADIEEMETVNFSPNVKFLIQTGGSESWQTEKIPSDTIGRYLYDSNGWHYQGSFADADMGDVKTLTNFLKYGRDEIEPNFKPDHRMFIFWNHGGFVTVCRDERYRVDGGESELDLNEIHQAFSTVFPHASADNPPFEIIGFDACLRATYENANNIYGFTKYLIASQETESGVGWYYTDWIRALMDNPSIDSQKLSKIICDGSIDFLRQSDDEDALIATFSVMDLSKSSMLNLRNDYNAFGRSLLDMIKKYPEESCALFDRSSHGISYNEAMTPLVDLWSFAQNLKQQLDYSNDIDDSLKTRVTESADKLLTSIDSTVVYNVHGKLNDDSHGISFYYPVKSPFDVSMSEELTKKKHVFELYQKQKNTPRFTRQINENRLKYWSSIQPENDNKQSDSLLSFDISKPDTSSSSSFYDPRKSGTIPILIGMKDLDESSETDPYGNFYLEHMNTLGNYEYEFSIQLTKDQMRTLSNVCYSVVFGGEDWDFDREEWKEFIGDDIEHLELYSEETAVASDLRSLKEYADKSSIEDQVSFFKLRLEDKLAHSNKYSDEVANALKLASMNDFSYEVPDLKFDSYLFVGYNTDINQDWKNGYFSKQFNGEWMTLDGHFVFPIVESSKPDVKDSSGNVIQWGYTNYVIPVLINNVPHNLKVSYQNSDHQYIIIGASRNDQLNGNSKRSKASRGYTHLKEGDEVVPIFMEMLIGTNVAESERTILYQDIPLTYDGKMGHMAVNWVGANKFKIGKKPVVDTRMLPKLVGIPDIDAYYLAFQAEDIYGNVTSSGQVVFNPKDFDPELEEVEYNFDWNEVEKALYDAALNRNNRRDDAPVGYNIFGMPIYNDSFKDPQKEIEEIFQKIHSLRGASWEEFERAVSEFRLPTEVEWALEDRRIYQELERRKQIRENWNKRK